MSYRPCKPEEIARLDELIQYTKKQMELNQASLDYFEKQKVEGIWVMDIVPYTGQATSQIKAKQGQSCKVHRSPK